MAVCRQDADRHHKAQNGASRGQGSNKAGGSKPEPSTGDMVLTTVTRKPVGEQTAAQPLVKPWVAAFLPISALKEFIVDCLIVQACDHVYFELFFPSVMFAMFIKRHASPGGIERHQANVQTQK